MIGFQEYVINNNINVYKLAEEINISPGAIYRWFNVGRIPNKQLDVISNKFNLNKEYLSKKVNDVSTYVPRDKEFNDYKIIDDYTTIIYLYKKNGEKLECYIDTKDLDLLIKLNKRFWSKWDKKAETYYASTRIVKSDGRVSSKLLHNIIMNTNHIIHHKDHNGLHNKKENLEVLSNQLNSTDRKGKNKNNKSGYRNVCWNKQREQWMVQIQIDGKNTRLGYFNDVDEAGKFAEEMRRKYYGKYAGKG